MGIFTIGVAASYNKELEATLKDSSDVLIPCLFLVGGLVPYVIESIPGLITKSGLIHLEIHEVKNILREVGTVAVIGTGGSKGKNRAKNATPNAQVIWGHVIDDNTGDDFPITYIAG